MTDSEKDFIERATSSEYAKYLLEEKLLENAKGIFTRYKWFVISITSLIVIIIGFLGIRQISFNKYISSSKQEVNILRDSLRTELKTLELFKKQLGLDNSELELDWKEKQGSINSYLTTLESKEENFNNSNALSKNYNDLFKSNLDDIRTYRSELRNTFEEAKKLLKDIDMTNKNSKELLNEIDTITINRRIKALEAIASGIRKETIFLTGDSQSYSLFDSKLTLNFISPSINKNSVTTQLNGKDVTFSLNTDLSLDFIPDYSFNLRFSSLDRREKYYFAVIDISKK